MIDSDAQWGSWITIIYPSRILKLHAVFTSVMGEYHPGLFNLLENTNTLRLIDTELEF